MYRIKVINTETEQMFIEYGFSKYMMKRIHFFLNETDNDFYHIYEIIDLSKLVFNFSTFMKCLTHCTETKQEG